MENWKEKKFCNICKDVLVDPVTLACHHTFCKECVEGLLKFRYDGCAAITCPMKCMVETRLSPDVTASSLVTNIESYINVELSSSCTDRKAVCRWKICTRKISRFCLTCEFTFCCQCWNEHLAQCDNTLPHTPVRYNYKTNDISVICVEHQTRASFVCLNCDYKFICIYCKHRTHKCHFVCSICVKLSNLFSGLFVGKPRTGLQMHKLTLNEVEKCEEKLKVELKKRKLKCLVDYLELLNKEESKLLLDFQRQCSLLNTLSDEHAKQENGRIPQVPIIEVSLTSCVMSTSSVNLGNLDIKLTEIASGNQGHAGICLHFQETEINMENRDFKEEFEDCLSIGRELSPKESNSTLNPDALPVFFPSKDLAINPILQTHSNLNPEAQPVFYPKNNGTQNNVVAVTSPDSVESPLAVFLSSTQPACPDKWSPEHI